MKVQLFVVVFLWMFLELPVLITSFIEPYEVYQMRPDSSVIIAYSQSTKIENHCRSLLTSASELKPDDNRGSRLKDELSFYLGDWDQENDGAPLVQLDNHDDPDDQSSQSPASLLKLASFEVIDVNSIQQLKNTVSLGGVLSVGVSRDSSYDNGVILEPQMDPGSSVVKIVFEGIYMETEENKGERLLCLVGSSTSTIPSTNICSSDESSEFSTTHGFPFTKRCIRFLQDDQVLLVLRYPKIFELTGREIRGEMVSLNEQGGPRHFTKVYISSQLSGLLKYRFSSELLQSRTFDPPPYQDELMEDGVQMLTGSEFCRVLYNDVYGEFPSIAPNYRFKSSYKNQIDGRLGPFVLRKEMQGAGDLSYDDIKLIFQHIKCEQDTNGTGNAKISAVLRAVTKGSYNLQHLQRLRTGLSGSTLVAEGIWNSSSGQLFMVGCQGAVGSGSEGCDYVIAMYFPRSYSIKQRSHLFGIISNVKKDISLDNPLYFSAIRSLSSRDFTEYLSYNYSKIKLVNAFERRTLPYQILNIAKKWLFQYPGLQEAEEPLHQLNQMFESLALDGYVDPYDQLISGSKSRILIHIKVLSLGPLSGWSEPNLVGNLRKKPVITKDDLTSCRFWNVSLLLGFTNEKEYKQTTYKNVSDMSLEGVYDPILGEMHLIGCRKAAVGSIDIERGQDCLIEVKIQYPPVNLQWWKNPTAEITISSQRKNDDPLYFSLINIRAPLTHYPDYFEAAYNRAYADAVVGIVLLTGSIAIIRSQLIYMKVSTYVVPYISTSMLAFQTLGYSLPLICGTKTLLKSKAPEDYRARFHGLPSSGMLKVLQCFENVLLLVALLLTARIFQMVKESKSKLRYDSREKMIMLSTMAIYTSGFLICLVARDHNPENDTHHAPRNQDMWGPRMVVMEDFVYVLQDYFLIPQIISNALMPMPVKSLRETYYLGFTSVRLLLQIFYHMTDPVLNAKGDRFEFSSSNSTSAMLPKVAAPITMIISAIIVYIQQKWKYQKAYQVSKLSRFIGCIIIQGCPVFYVISNFVFYVRTKNDRQFEGKKKYIYKYKFINLV